MLPPEPAPPAVAHHWRYADVRPELSRAADEITAELAERRVLLFENPSYPGESRILATLHAGIQYLLPGETAAPHRHAQSALRFILEGEGAFTEVGGERYPMAPGDLILTPAFTWHGHGNPGNGSVAWLDGLDLPMVRLMGTTFADFKPPATGIPTIASGTSHARFGSGMLPAESLTPRPASPRVHYPYAQSRAALAMLALGEAADPVHGYRLAYAHSQTGGPVMPTMAAYLQLLPSGFGGKNYRSTEAFVFCVAEGKGATTVVGVDGTEKRFEWSPHDHFVIPGWLRFRHEAETESVLFSFSDCPIQKTMGLWREARD
jgi:gentisate 1,2-dioxygenase